MASSEGFGAAVAAWVAKTQERMVAVRAEAAQDDEVVAT